ncbi:hypothetical protein ACH42_05400 [Endozoicomonas sp. (ex Bugula neritina AB1)]|nr:hypothetical protein ACH42_05400 [Endozoicomonas sp. (ex Bugula neritina AB1)]
MKTYAYVRVSTIHQNVDTQKLAILSFAQKENIVVDHFVETVMSSRKNAQKEQLAEMIDRMNVSGWETPSTPISTNQLFLNHPV